MTSQWNRFEVRLTAGRDHEDPLAVRAVAGFRHESGAVREYQAFWDGGREWVVRVSPDLPGHWTWKTRCSEDDALDGVAGEFECGPAEGLNSLYRHGAVRIAASKTHFEHSDGSPYFWLGDTAWNGPLKSGAADWETYLADRQAKRFSAIQFVATQWLAAAGDREGRRAYNGLDPIRIDPVFFRRLDARVDAINRHGMVAAPVLAWAAAWNRDARDLNPGTSLSVEQIARLAGYLVARYGAHHVAWILAGDGDYRGEAADCWRSIGRAVFGESRHLVTMHPGGRTWVAGEFADEPWYRFNGYQSGHWREDSIRWITQGEPSQRWRTDSTMPHVDLETCYEGHEDFGEHRPFSAADVRRAAWSTLLAVPPAGLTYGAHGIWSWESERNQPMNHPRTGPAPSWKEAMELPGSTGMRHLRDICESTAWWRLRPCPELVAVQPGLADANRFVSAACSPERDLALVYLPQGGEIALRTEMLQPGLTEQCFDPETGGMSGLAGQGDRVLIFRRGDSA